jgi:hypothetical protein
MIQSILPIHGLPVSHTAALCTVRILEPLNVLAKRHTPC